jgi:hypothetical protein
VFACCFLGRCAPLSRRLVAQGVFVTTEPAYASQPWGASQPMMLGLHSDDENGAHMGSTPSVPTMADFQQHTVKIRYTRGFTTEKQGSGTVTTSDIVDSDNDRRRLQGDSLTRFKSELRTGFEFGYASRVKANVKVKLQRDATDPLAQGPAVLGAAFGDDGVAVRVTNINDDDSADLEDTNLAGATSVEADARAVLAPAFTPAQASGVKYNIIKEFPGEIQVFIDDMDRYVFQVAVEDRDMAKILDGDGNAFIGFTASTGSRGFALPGYDPEEVHQTHDIVSWNFCNNPGCVPCACAMCLLAVCMPDALLATQTEPAAVQSRCFAACHIPLPSKQRACPSAARQHPRRGRRARRRGSGRGLDGRAEAQHGCQNGVSSSDPAARRA